ncbi:MAG: tRNA (adenosine(37)-N6)-threonylcarbamoyltransferase complex ATPase subunit type 1 TsaE [Bacteroidaceae bacterium]|nr:tRNA (adenosine(37)-N6)-threonylcarbamoyltransferase complex ATPase subunit type 1 TsaE [Bacteroidaceae bacterium]
MEIRIPDLNSIDTAAEQFVNNMGNRSIFAFYGKMGAGKTTFIRAVCHKLGVEEEVTSPSFAIVNEYRSDTLGESIFHFDFYRIKKIEEVYDLGYEDYFYGGGLNFIEWPELIEPLLPEDTVKVEIAENSDGGRVVKVDD